MSPPCAWSSVSSLHLDPPFLLLALPSALFLNYMKSVVNLHNSCNESVDSTDEFSLFFVPLWRELADQLKILFPDGDDEGAFIIPALDTRSHVLSIKDRRNGVGKLVFKLAPLGSGQTYTFVHLICLFLVFLLKCYNGFSLKPTGLMCDGRPLALRAFSPPGGSNAFLCGFQFRWVLHIVPFDSWCYFA